jgi:hypothetical protein
MTTINQPEEIEHSEPQLPQELPKPRDTQRILWNVLTIGIVLLTLCCCCYFLIVFTNPYLSLNPFPPNTPVAPLQLPTATWTPISLPPTWTPTVTPIPPEKATLRPTFTPIFTETPLVLFSPMPTDTALPTETLSPTPEPTGVPFTVSVKYVDSAIIHPDLGCNFFGVGGSVFDLKDNPFKGLVVSLSGRAGGKVIQQLTVSGTAPAYGQSGFEFNLGTKPVDSQGTLFVQLLDQAGLPLSPKTPFDTHADCAKSLPIVRFEQIR